MFSQMNIEIHIKILQYPAQNPAPKLIKKIQTEEPSIEKNKKRREKKIHFSSICYLPNSQNNHFARG